MTTPDSRETGSYDARTGDGDPMTDPAAAGEAAVAHPDGDGGAVPGESEPAGPGSDG